MLQLVVVGDQSSGKSSLLEGLTGLSFPTDNGLCTRFATQIILRRSDQTQARVSILPGPTASQDPETKKALEQFNPVIGKEGLVGPRLTEILDQVGVQRTNWYESTPADTTRRPLLWVCLQVLKRLPKI